MATPSLIRDYEEEFTSACESVKRDLNGLRAGFPAPAASPSESTAGPSATPPPHAITNDRPAVNRTVAASLRRMRDVLSNLEIETTQAPPDVRADLKGRITGYKATLAGLEKEAAVVKKKSADADREALLRTATTTADRNVAAAGGAAGAAGDDAETLRIKQQLARNTQRMKAGSNTLRDAERLTVEMNDMADDTLEHLERQGQKIRGIGETVRATDEELSHVQRILRKMHREMLKNKLMLSAIIAVLLIMIIGILYYKFGRTSATHSDAAAGVSGGSHDVPTLPPPTPGASGGNSWIPTMPPPPPSDPYATGSADSRRARLL